MNIKSFERIVNDRTDLYNDAKFNKNVARVIKNKRLQNSMTQSEVAEGICSISYISKIESGKCPPDNFYVREVMSKMGITLQEVMISEFTNELYELVEAMYYDDHHKVQVLVDITADSGILSAKLVQLAGRYYLKDKIDSLLEYINALKNDLTDFELRLFMLIIAKYEADQMKHKRALKYLMILKELDETNDYLRFMVDFQIAESNMYTGNYVRSYYYLNQLESHLNDAYEIINRYKVKLMQVEVLIYTNKVELAALELGKFNRINNKEVEAKFLLLSGLVELEMGESIKAINFLLKSQPVFFELSVLNVIRAYYKMGSRSKMEEFRTILKEGTNDLFYVKMANYFLVKETDNLYEIREFINSNLLQIIKKLDYDYFFDMVWNDLIKFHRTNSRYKAIDEIRFRMSDKK